MNDKGIVTSGQLFVLFFISRIIIAVFCSPKISGVNTLWDYFLPVIISLFLSMLMLVPVLVMYRQNRQMSVSEYSYRYFGKAGNVITILYALYFFVGCVYSLSVYYGFLKFISPDGIQISLILILLVIACVYASFKGLEAVSRLSGIVLVIIIIAAVILISFLSSELS
ncbi:MAG: GerAB/ArcD/ProY family transporter, partial [Acutalibacteraceae bacterium]